jgi:hypothetical protein
MSQRLRDPACPIKAGQREILRRTFLAKKFDFESGGLGIGKIFPSRLNACRLHSQISVPDSIFAPPGGAQEGA